MMIKRSSILIDLMLISLVISAYLFLTACSSAPIERFPEVKPGMDKDQVLQIIGNPYRTEKTAVHEHWGYRYYTGEDKNTEVLKYVDFINGRVSSYGDDEEEMRRLRQLREKEVKRGEREKKQEKVDDALEKEYSH